jgi:uncharacterized membrane protein YbhN (UPF0104 family)
VTVQTPTRSSGRAPATRPGRQVHWKHRLGFVLALVVAGSVANLLGWDIPGWFQRLWDVISGISPVYLLGGIALITLQAVMMSFAYLRILRFAYPQAQVRWLEVLAAYAASVALNCVLPANLAPLILLVMLTFIVPGSTFAGMLAVYGVQKIFFVLVGVYPYLYLFLSVGGSFSRKFGFVVNDPWATGVLLVGGVLLIVLIGHLLWPRIATRWQQAKTGGQILVHPRLYFPGVVFPEAAAWLAGVGVIAVFFAAYDIRVSVQALVRVVAANSIAGGASVTPGAVGVTQALNVASLSGIASPVQATAYSVAQQLVLTTWSILLAIVLMVWAFGWSGGERLIAESYGQVRHEEATRKAEHQATREAQREVKGTAETGPSADPAPTEQSSG